MAKGKEGEGRGPEGSTNKLSSITRGFGFHQYNLFGFATDSYVYFSCPPDSMSQTLHHRGLIVESLYSDTHLMDVALVFLSCPFYSNDFDRGSTNSVKEIVVLDDVFHA